MLYINVRVPVDNADSAGAVAVCKELLAGERPGELLLVSDRVWISDDSGQELAVVKVADAGDDPAAPSV